MYMAMGTAPLVSDVGDLHSYVQDGQAGVVIGPGNVEALASALIELLQDEERRVRIAKEAWRLAWGDHSWQTRTEVWTVFLSETIRAIH
jgi:glycosyltransferase involved in cell wall biosynthesis